MHGSVDNDLITAVKADIKEYEKNVFAQGYYMRRIPTIDILPIDKEARKRDRIK